MAKPGDRYVCGVCGIEVSCVEGCGCSVCNLMCCGRPMKKKKPKKAAKKKR